MAQDADAKTEAPAWEGAAEEKIPFWARFAYGSGAISTAVKNAAFGYLLLYYNQVVGIPAAIVSTAIAATLIVDALVDPLIGRWSDVTRSRIGRRHPFILGSAIPTALFFILLWFPPAGLTDIQTGIWIFAVASLTRVAVSAYDIPSTAMVPELTRDYSERTKLFSLRFWFGYAGTFAFIALSLSLFFVKTPEHPVGQLNPDGYVKFAFAGGFAMLFSILACGLGTLGQVSRMRQADAPAPMRMSMGGHLREIGAAFRHRSFLAIFAFGVLKFTAIGMASAMAIYFNTYVFDLSAKQVALLALEAVTAATLAAPLAPLFSRRLGKRQTAMWMAILGIVINNLPLALVYFGLFFPSGHPMVVPTLLVVGTIGGGFIAISLINTSSMLADVVEDYAVKSGKHLSGVFFSASSFMQQCSAALGVFAAGLVLTWSAFPEKASPATVTREMELSLLVHYVPTIVVLWLAGCLFLLFYNIDQDRHRANIQKLRSLEAEENARQLQDAGVASPTF
ncbi:MFS transporter [Sphingopyxis sp.]|uniref:MFS transporter n=1 Tax=Sphingopyxis sp. TaxID=1908224 RepID=UPI0025F780C3|nr:MFS transporter [Sphingopyxis sp.]MBR2173863.1 MFS transporter [Sphingopyxis sp.]